MHNKKIIVFLLSLLSINFVLAATSKTMRLSGKIVSFNRENVIFYQDKVKVKASIDLVENKDQYRKSQRVTIKFSKDDLNKKVFIKPRK